MKKFGHTTKSIARLLGVSTEEVESWLLPIDNKDFRPVGNNLEIIELNLGAKKW